MLNIPLADFLAPITALSSTQFIAARAAARHMVSRGRGTVLTLSASPAPLAIPETAGWGVVANLTAGMAVD